MQNLSLKISDWHKFLFIAELDENGVIVRWGYCLPDCPHEEIKVACIHEPIFPDFLFIDDGYHQNLTSNYIPGSGEVLLELDYVTFECPLGYVVEGSSNVTNYAFCHNWIYAYKFDMTKSCVRKCQS